MQKRKLGYSDLVLTTIGVGTWAIGGGDNPFGWGSQDDADSIAAIRRALDVGINWIDTAAGYGHGHSEEVVGKAIAGRRDEAVVATKCGVLWKEDGSDIYVHLKADSIRREVEDSLRRLNVDVIDLYQIHWPSGDNVEVAEGWSAVAGLIKAGKIRYGGVSNFNVQQLKLCQEIHPIASLQPPYSMLTRGVEDEILPFCGVNNIGVIAYSPMERGLLTGKMTRDRVSCMPVDDHRRMYPPFQMPQLEANLELVESLRPIAEKKGKTLAQLAIAWVLRRPEMTGAIVGVRRPQQVDDIAPGGDWNLTSEEISTIDALLAKRDAALA